MLALRYQSSAALFGFCGLGDEQTCTCGLLLYHILCVCPYFPMATLLLSVLTTRGFVTLDSLVIRHLNPTIVAGIDE